MRRRRTGARRGACRLLRGRHGRDRRPVVRREDLLVARLVHAADQVHQRVDPRQDLEQLVGLVDRADGDLRAHRPERLARLGPTDGRPHLVVPDERADDRPPEDAPTRRSPARSWPRDASDASPGPPTRRYRLTDGAARSRRRSRAPSPRRAARRVAAGRGARGAVDPPVRRRPPDGTSAFVKIAAFDYVAGWFRDERAAYEAFEGAPSSPAAGMGRRRRGAAPRDRGPLRRPLAAAVDRRSMRSSRRSTTCTRSSRRSPLPTAEERQFGLDSWPDVSRTRSRCSARALCSSAWLDEHLEALATASAAARIDGTAALHFDVRSDNLCLRDGRRDPGRLEPRVPREPAARHGRVAAEPGGRGRSGARRDPPPPRRRASPRLAALLAGYFAAERGSFDPAGPPRPRPPARAGDGRPCRGPRGSSASTSVLTGPRCTCNTATIRARGRLLRRPDGRAPEPRAPDDAATPRGRSCPR